MAGILNVSVADLLSQSPSGQSPPEVKEYIQDLIGMAMSNVQKGQKTQKNLAGIVAVCILIIPVLTGLLIGMARFVRKPSFQIIRTEYTTSAVPADAIHILYYDSMEKLKISESYFQEVYILTQ